MVHLFVPIKNKNDKYPTFSQKVVTMRVIVLILTLCMIPAAFIQFIIEDRVSDSFHLQIVSGLRKRTYWIAGFVYDLV